MIDQPIELVLIVWFPLALLSTAYVAHDQFMHNPEAGVMKWGFVLITLYMGPLGLLISATKLLFRRLCGREAIRATRTRAAMKTFDASRSVRHLLFAVVAMTTYGASTLAFG